jgi:hypothetical protein
MAVKRSINGFDIDWVGEDRIEVRRDRAPKHGYEFETSPDRWRITALRKRKRLGGTKFTAMQCY